MITFGFDKNKSTASHVKFWRANPIDVSYIVLNAFVMDGICLVKSNICMYKTCIRNLNDYRWQKVSKSPKQTNKHIN